MSRRDGKLTAEERGLFEAEVRDARPLEHEQRGPARGLPRPVSIAQREAEALRELDAVVRGDVPFAPCETEHWIQGSRPGLDARVLRRLARGEFAIQADLDLHGCDAETARERLERFLLEAVARGLRCVRVVHGRGRGSPSGIPVIKRQLPRWLSRGPARAWVLAYCSARPSDGGAGASYVLLASRPGG